MSLSDYLSSLVPLLLIIGLIVFVIKIRKADKKRKQKLIEDKISEVEKYFKRISPDNKIPEIKVDILLKKDESAFLQDNVKLLEVRSARTSTRGGTGFKVAKGVYVGGTTGISRSFDELREIDKGRLFLTNQRVIFEGRNNTRDIKLEKLISIAGYSDGIGISSEGKAKNQTYVGMQNAFLWKTLIDYIIKSPETQQT